MRTHQLALGVASLLAVSQAFADYSFSFTSRARHDSVGASAGQSGGSSFGGAASGSSGGDGAASSPGSFPTDDWFGAYSPLAGASFNSGTFDTAIVGTSGPNPCLDPAQWVLYASDVVPCSSALDAPTSARGKVVGLGGQGKGAGGGGGGGTGTPIAGDGATFPNGNTSPSGGHDHPGRGTDSNGSHDSGPVSSDGSGPVGSDGRGPTLGGIGQFSGPGSHRHHPANSPPIATGDAGGPGSHHNDPANWPPVATGGAGNSVLDDPTYGASSYPIEASLTSDPPLELSRSTPGAAATPEPGTLALVGLALLGLAILPLRTRH